MVVTVSEWVAGVSHWLIGDLPAMREQTERDLEMEAAAALLRERIEALESELAELEERARRVRPRIDVLEELVVDMRGEVEN